MTFRGGLDCGVRPKELKGETYRRFENPDLKPTCEDLLVPPTTFSFTSKPNGDSSPKKRCLNPISSTVRAGAIQYEFAIEIGSEVCCCVTVGVGRAVSARRLAPVLAGLALHDSLLFRQHLPHDIFSAA